MHEHISPLLGEHPRIVNIFLGPVTVHYREVSLYFQQLIIHGKLTLMLFLLFSMIFGSFYVDSHAVCAGTWNQLLCQILPFVVAVHIRATPSAKWRLQTSQSPFEINGSVLFVEGIMCDSLRVKIEQNKRE